MDLILPDSRGSSLLMTLQWFTTCFVNKTSVCIIRRTAGLLGPIYQNNYSNTIFISVQLALRWYLFTLPSLLSFSHIIRHSNSTAHTSSFHHSTRTRSHSTYSPHYVIIPPTLHTSSTRIMSTFHNQYANANTPLILQKAVTMPPILHTHLIIPPTSMSFCQDPMPICHRTHHVSPFRQYSTLHISQISTRICHHSTVISRCCYNNALWRDNSNSFHLPSSSAAKKETDRTMPTNKWQLLETLFKPTVR